MLIDRSSTIASDYAYCEKIIKRHSKSFYYAFSNLPKDKARAVYAIYAFCRTADDSVDENKTSGLQLIALDRLTDELSHFAKGQEVDHPLWRALRDVFNRFDMDIQPFYEQLTGQRMDIHFISPSNLSTLETYSKYVAGSVGKMLLPIIASNAKTDLNRVAEDLGIAMQLTNILRDVGEDYRDKVVFTCHKMKWNAISIVKLFCQKGKLQRTLWICGNILRNVRRTYMTISRNILENSMKTVVFPYYRQHMFIKEY